MTIVFSAVSALNAEQVRVAIPGTKLSCQPSPGFELSRNFVGFENTDMQVTFLVMEHSVPPTVVPQDKIIDYFKTALNEQLLESKGVTLLETERTTIGSLDSLILKGSLTANNIKFIQWIVILSGGKPGAAQIQITGPEPSFMKAEPEVIKMLNSFRWQARAAEIETYYTIDLPKNWGLAKQHGFVEIYSESGEFPAVRKDESLLTVLNMHEAVPESKRAKWVLNKNLNRNYFEQLVELENKMETINGWPANISFVSAVKSSDSKEVILQYCYIFLPHTTVFIEAERTSVMTKGLFLKTVRTWKLKRDSLNRLNIGSGK